MTAKVRALAKAACRLARATVKVGTKLKVISRNLSPIIPASLEATLLVAFRRIRFLLMKFRRSSQSWSKWSLTRLLSRDGIVWIKRCNRSSLIQASRSARLTPVSPSILNSSTGFSKSIFFRKPPRKRSAKSRWVKTRLKSQSRTCTIGWKWKARLSATRTKMNTPLTWFDHYHFWIYSFTTNYINIKISS